MMKHCVLSLFLGVMLCMHTGEGKPFQEFLGGVWEDAGYDKLVLVYTWGPSFCEREKCYIPSAAQTNKNWTIHGLWPFKSNTKPATMITIDCPGKYDKRIIAGAIRDRMERQWIGYKAGHPSDRFWAHEYERHGTCANDVFDSQLKYFEGTMDLADRYDIKTILAQGNNAVRPSSALKYPFSYIESALKKKLGVTPAVFCLPNAGDKRKATQFLFEVRVCFDKSLRAITCGDDLTGGGRCDGRKKVLYPPFDDYITTKSFPGSANYHSDNQFLVNLARTGAQDMRECEDYEKGKRNAVDLMREDFFKMLLICGKEDKTTGQRHDHSNNRIHGRLHPWGHSAFTGHFGVNSETQ